MGPKPLTITNPVKYLGSTDGREMSRIGLHIHADYAPPRSWEQFEELCADVFQSAWRDPALVRHGRAGQRQHGVDIVGRNGALYPIGMQCKRRSKWPVSKLTIREIDNEVKEALSFIPALKAFYILTTAPDDIGLQEHVRKLNEEHEKKNLFEVVLLGWSEIVRRATLDHWVADKHFGPSGGGAPRSPLLATWMMSNKKLELTGAELELSVTELVQDIHDWPDGHIVIRQRETDTLLEQLRPFESKHLSTAERKTRIRLRDDLRVLTDAEHDAARGVMLMLTDPLASCWLLEVWGRDAPLAIEGFINHQLRPLTVSSGSRETFLRLSPPGNPDQRCAAVLPEKAIFMILEKQAQHLADYEKPMVAVVAELPHEVRARIAVPRIVRGIFDFQKNSRMTWDEIQRIKALDLGNWTFSIA